MTPEDAVQPGTRSTPTGMLWAGRIVSTVPVLFMGVMAAFMLVAKPAMLTEGMTKYGFPTGSARPIVIVEIACAILYAIPRTAVLGAILLTGYLGGAVATHVRAGEPFIFPVIAGVLVWLGIYLRDARLRDLVPLRH
jgi:hypothetical protein